ncbi:MAG TPA: hypothetical protein VGO62_07815, partial [Myxococcota bacterium]
MKQTILVLSALGLVTQIGCVSDPARHLTESKDDVEITPDGSFIRGSEHLDEEEFYSLVGDQKSTDTIKADRAQGEMFEPLGIGIGAVGVALGVVGLGFYYLESKDDYKPIVGEGVDPYIGYGGLFGGIVAIAGGGYLWWDGHEKALGVTHLFDEKHATASLETARYGSGGATQSTVASIEVKTASGSETFCSVGATPLAPIKAFDDKHRSIKLDASRQSWFQWTSNPPQALAPAHDVVISPLGSGLGDLGKDVIYTVKVDAPTNVTTQLDLKVDYGCPKPWFGFGGDGGAGGSGGSSGESAGSAGQSGGPGGPGGQGGDGGRGHDVEVEAAALTGPNGEQLVLAAVQERGGSGVDLAVFDPKKAGPLLIVAEGGQGGQGGSGGSGGNGWSYGSGDTCSPGGAGGNGGSG